MTNDSKDYVRTNLYGNLLNISVRMKSAKLNLREIAQLFSDFTLRGRDPYPDFWAKDSKIEVTKRAFLVKICVFMVKISACVVK